MTQPTKAIKPKRPPGRPSIFTADLAEVIVHRHAAGESLRQIGADPAMPDRTTIARWEEEDRGGFASDLARARKLFAEDRAMRAGDHLYELDDSDLKDLGSAASSAVKLRESRSAHDRYLAARLDPGQWGERVGLDVNAQVTIGTSFATTLPGHVIEAIAREASPPERSETDPPALGAGDDDESDGSQDA